MFAVLLRAMGGEAGNKIGLKDFAGLKEFLDNKVTVSTQVCVT